MPQIIILRPPRSGRSAELTMNADVTVISGGSKVELANAGDVLIVSSGGQLDIYTDEDARNKILKSE